MELLYGIDHSGDLKKATCEIHNPDALILITSEENFEKHVKELEMLFPSIPSIGGTGSSYAGSTITENGVTVIGLFGINTVADVLENVSTMPVKYINRVQNAIDKVGAVSGNSACFDFCTGSDGKMVTTMNLLLNKKEIPLVGGTVATNHVSANGKVYKDSCVFLLLKNKSGKVCVYKENIYLPTGERFIATKTDSSNKIIKEINGIPAEQFYRQICHISKDEVSSQTFKNPLGRVFGNEIYLISIKEPLGNDLECYKQVNDMDILTLMEINDYSSVIDETITNIKKQLPNVKGVLSVNCIFRYLFFKQENYLNIYFDKMNKLGMHAGLIGFGEHYKKQHINQTMCCIAFD